MCSDKESFLILYSHSITDLVCLLCSFQNKPFLDLVFEKPGVTLLHAPEPSSYFDWQTGWWCTFRHEWLFVGLMFSFSGKFTKANHNLLIAGGSAPQYEFRGKFGSNFGVIFSLQLLTPPVLDVGTRKCIREFSLVKGEETKVEDVSPEREESKQGGGEDPGAANGGQAVEPGDLGGGIEDGIQGGGNETSPVEEWRWSCACISGDYIFFADAIFPTLHLMDLRSLQRTTTKGNKLSILLMLSACVLFSEANKQLHK